MANPNLPPPAPVQPPEKKPTVNERYLDHDSILGRKSGAEIVHESSDAIKKAYETYLTEALNNGAILNLNPQGGNTTPATIDATKLKDAYWRVCQEIASDPNAKKSGDGIISDMQDLPASSYASLVVANYPHPESFLTMMHEAFTASNPNADVTQKQDFAKGLDHMAQLLYSSRYQDYEQQRHDMDLLGVEASQEEHEAHNHEVIIDMLGQNYKVRRGVHEFAMKARDKRSSAWTSLRNKGSSPKKAYLEARMKSAEEKLRWKQSELAAKQRSIDQSQKKLDSSNGWFSGLRQSRIDARQDKLDRKNQKYQDKVDIRTDAYKTHVAKMDGRKQEALDKAQVHRERYLSHINNYKEQQEVAIANRALRCELKGVGFKERQERLAAFHAHAGPEEVKRLARVSHIEDSAKRKADRLRNRHQSSIDSAIGHDTRATQLDGQISANVATISQLRGKIDQMQQSLVPKAEQRLDAATIALADSDPTQHDYAALETRRESAARFVAQLQIRTHDAENALRKLQSRTSKLTTERDQLRRRAGQERTAAADTYNKLVDADRTERTYTGGTQRAIHKIQGP